MAFRVGDLVEVCCDEDGFWGAYYEAKIVSNIEGKDKKFVVEYKTLLEDNEKDWLMEVVEASKIRPLPPQINVPEFHVLEKVDAFDNDGWWVGRITGRAAGYKYYVYFESSGDEILYPVGSLRIHHEYENGQWFAANQMAYA